MDSDDPALQPVIVLRVVIRSPDLDTFVAKYARFVKDDRIFIFTKSSQPTGTRVRFTLELADGQPLIHGEGTVTRIRPDGGDPSKPPGMELKFVPLDGPSRELVARMLAAREQAEQFRDETTDVQTKVRDGAAAARREFDEAPPTLPPLQKTGKAPAIDDTPPPRQDESGAVTLAQAPPGGGRPSQRLEAPDTRPSGGFHSPTEPGTPPPGGERPSGGFSTPTPLPAPIPAPSDEFHVTAPQTRMERPAPRDSGELGEVPFAALGPAPSFAEAFRSPMPGGPSVTPPSGTVPANPFSQVSNTAIEYFVEWSLEQSTAPKPKVAAASFANVPMATPRAEKRRSARAPLLGGLALGLGLGVPLGGAAMWYLAPTPRPVIVERMPEPRPQPAASVAAAALPDLGLAHAGAPDPAATALARAMLPPERPALAAIAPRPTAKPARPPATADKADAPAAHGKLVIGTRPSGATVTVDGEARGKTPLTLTLAAGQHEVALAHERYAPVTQSVEVPGRLEVTLKRPQATLHVESEPPGGEVIVEGRPRGKTPVDVTLDAFHHYDVQVMLLGTKPWHKRVSLRPPQTDVTARLSVVHNP